MTIITDLVLIESQTARSSQLERLHSEQAQEILNKIKSLYFALWQGKESITTDRVALFYEVPETNLRKLLKTHREELTSDGLETIRGQALKDARDLWSLPSKTSQATIWTPRAVLRVGMLMRESAIAVAVRTSLLNVVEKTIPAIVNQKREILALPSAREELETIKLGIDLFSELGGCDERTEILLKDRIRNILLKERFQPSLNPAVPRRLEYPVSDRAITLGYKPNNSQLQQIGKRASRLYQENHNSKPPQREQFVGGTTRMVNVYGHEDLELLDRAILSVMDKDKIATL